MKKAQAALEFLMTYGWAILVVLAAIAALAYFGVLSPDRFLPEKCTMPQGFACIDFTTTGTGVVFVLQNSLGVDVSALSFAVDGTGCSVTASGPATLDNGEQGTYTATCSPSSGKFKGTITLTYTNTNTGLSHTKIGELIAQFP